MGSDIEVAALTGNAVPGFTAPHAATVWMALVMTFDAVIVVVHKSVGAWTPGQTCRNSA